MRIAVPVAVTGVTVVLLTASRQVLAQQIQCRAITGADSVYRGPCSRADTVLGHIIVNRPTAATPHLWRGTAAFGGARPVELALDIRPDGTLRLGRSWLRLYDAQADSVHVQFAFSADSVAPATHIDAQILRRARAYLADSSQWNRLDTTDMDAAPTKGFFCAPAPRQSMFCALYLASIEVAQDYAHFRPAMNAVREAVSVQGNRAYRHPLVDFNNDPVRTIADIQEVLDAALDIVLR